MCALTGSQAANGYADSPRDLRTVLGDVMIANSGELAEDTLSAIDDVYKTELEGLKLPSISDLQGPTFTLAEVTGKPSPTIQIWRGDITKVMTALVLW